MTLYRKLHRGIRIGDRHIFNLAWRTEPGPGRIVSFRFFGGAGYVWRPYGKIRGFDLSIRVRKARPGKYRAGMAAPPFVWLTTNPHKYYPH